MKLTRRRAAAHRIASKPASGIVVGQNGRRHMSNVPCLTLIWR
jgi:hypothetical protein